MPCSTSHADALAILLVLPRRLHVEGANCDVVFRDERHKQAILPMGYQKKSCKYSSSLKHLLTPQQWLLQPRMRSLHLIVCLPGQRTHEKSFLKALLMIQGVMNEL